MSYFSHIAQIFETERWGKGSIFQSDIACGTSAIGGLDLPAHCAIKIS